MLDDSERRRLAEIEQGLVDDDPRLEARFHRGRRWHAGERWPDVSVAAGVIVAVLLLLLGLAPQALVVLILSALPLVWVRMLRPKQADSTEDREPDR